jgi:hypothetical protein
MTDQKFQGTPADTYERRIASKEAFKRQFALSNVWLYEKLTHSQVVINKKGACQLFLVEFL